MKERYRIVINDIKYLNQAESRSRCKVQILDQLTGRLYKRMGDGQQIGNFHPIWVNWHGKKVNIEELAKETIQDGQ